MESTKMESLCDYPNLSARRRGTIKAVIIYYAFLSFRLNKPWNRKKKKKLKISQVFDENELEYLMCGITQIDVEDWCTYTEFKGGYSPSHHVVVWFWKVCTLL